MIVDAAKLVTLIVKLVKDKPNTIVLSVTQVSMPNQTPTFIVLVLVHQDTMLITKPELVLNVTTHVLLVLLPETTELVLLVMLHIPSTTELVLNHAQVECITTTDTVPHVTLLVLNVTDLPTTNVMSVITEPT